MSPNFRVPGGMMFRMSDARGRVSSLRRHCMMQLQFLPVLVSGAKNSGRVPAAKPRKANEILMEAVAVLFFILGPVLGAALFLMWFGGLVWGVLSSLFR